MRKKQKKQLMYGLIIFGIIVGYLYFSGNLPLTISPINTTPKTPTGKDCTYVTNPNTPGYSDKISVSNGSQIVYYCKTDHCYISAEMLVEKATLGGGEAWTCTWDGKSSSPSSLASCQGTIISTSKGSCHCGGTACPCTSIGVPATYSATFGLCSPNSPINLPSCTQTETSSGLKGVGEYDIVGSATNPVQIVFNPKYSDGTNVDSKTLYVRNYDCTCAVKQVSQNYKYCDASNNLVFCNPKVKYSCNKGTFEIRPYCLTLDGNLVDNYLDNKCNNGGACYSPVISQDPTWYNACTDSETQTSGAVCSIFSAGLTQCPSAKPYCIMNGTTTTGGGLGYCGCIGGCNEGDVRKGNLTDKLSYEKCTNGCAGTWTTQYCSLGTYFDSTSKKCVASSNCSGSTDNRCSTTNSNNINLCISKYIPDSQCQNNMCTAWLLSADSPCSISGEKVCINNACTCPTTSCTLNSIQCDGQTSFLTCTKPSDDYCPKFRNSQTVASVYGSNMYCNNNQISQKPGCSNNNSANHGCTSDQYCQDDATGGTCMCKTSGTDVINGVTTEHCSQNSVSKCSSNSLFVCTKQTDGCYNYIKNSNPPADKQCIDGQTDWSCLTTGDYCTNGQTSSYRDCIGGRSSGCYVWSCKTSGNSAVGINIGNTRCNAQTNTIEVVSSSVSTENCPIWMPKTDALNTQNGVCNSGFICNPGTGTNTAFCETPDKYMSIVGKNEFGVGEQVNGILVLVKDTVPSPNNNDITVILTDSYGQSQAFQHLTPTLINGQRMVNLSTGVTYSTKQTVKVQAIAGDVGTSLYRINKDISIKNILSISTLTCQPSFTGYAGQDIICSWVATDRTTGSEPSGVIYTLEVSPSSIIKSQTTKSVTINSNSIGTVSIKVYASCNDYISTTASTNVNIQDNDFQTELLIDNKPLSSYTNGISQGKHDIELKITRNNQVADIQSVAFTISLPSGSGTGTGVEQLSLLKSGDYWVGSYDFKQAGYNYIIGYDIKNSYSQGNFVPTDVSLLSKVKPVTFTISTSQTITEDLKSQTNSLIIYVVAGAVIFIIFIIIVAVIYRKNVNRVSPISYTVQPAI